MVDSSVRREKKKPTGECLGRWGLRWVVKDESSTLDLLGSAISKLEECRMG